MRARTSGQLEIVKAMNAASRYACRQTEDQNTLLGFYTVTPKPWHFATPCMVSPFFPQVKEWRAVGGLGKAPKLTYLTLYFNPVCKRKMYRQFTTNSCGFLRGLDLHAVSDEEVVEGSKYFESSRWKACSSALALPQPLLNGLMEVASFTPTQQEEKTVKLRNQPSRSAAAVRLVEDRRRPRSDPNNDDLVLTSVLRRVQLLRKFHARNSPVIIGQRQIRRFNVQRLSYRAAVKIQTCVRKWLVELRSVVALKDILQETDELYLVQVCARHDFEILSSTVVSAGRCT